MNRFENQISIVTGAGRGIGEAIAKALAAGGGKVACVSRSDSAAKVAQAINAAYPDTARAYTVDVADKKAVEAVSAQIFADFGKVDILVNNAGITRDGLAMRMSEEDWDAVIDTNLKGAFNFIQAVMRPMITQRSGRIINISSVIGLIGNAGQSNYAASKAGLIGFTQSVAREFASRGITVNAIAPGFIETDMTAELNEALRAEILKKIPLGCLGQSDDIAAGALYLASPAARYVTGQVLTVDGGMVM